MTGRCAIAVSAVAGFAVMNIEIAAGRLLAPYYGTSTTTWAMLIGTIMLSLATGGLAGGWLSRRADWARWPARLLAAAAALSALLPRIAPLIMAGSLGRFRAGEIGALAGSAAAVAVLIALPIACLAAASPLLLAAAARRDSERLEERVGGLSGRLGAAGTLGGLAGTFGAGLLFIPWLGTSRTLHLGALCLAAVAAALAVAARQRRFVALTLALAALVGAGLARPTAAPSPPGRLIHAEESRLNTITVAEAGGEIQLRVNDGYAVQSFARRDGALPLRDVWAFYALAPTWAARRVDSVLLLGMGGGTAAEVTRRLYPDARITGVEIDPAIVLAGADWLGFDLSGIDVRIDDARAFVAAAAGRGERHDVIILDAFQFPYVPFQLATDEFFRDLSRCLAPGGVVMVNVGRHGHHRDVVDAVARTLAGVFARVDAADAPGDSNTILVAADHAAGDAVGLAGVPRPAQRALARFAGLRQRMRPATWAADAPVLTDDHAPVEWLTDRILWSAL